MNNCPKSTSHTQGPKQTAIPGIHNVSLPTVRLEIWGVIPSLQAGTPNPFISRLMCSKCDDQAPVQAIRVEAPTLLYHHHYANIIGKLCKTSAWAPDIFISGTGARTISGDRPLGLPPATRMVETGVSMLARATGATSGLLCWQGVQWQPLETRKLWFISYLCWLGLLGLPPGMEC